DSGFAIRAVTGRALCHYGIGCLVHFPADLHAGICDVVRIGFLIGTASGFARRRPENNPLIGRALAVLNAERSALAFGTRLHGGADRSIPVGISASAAWPSKCNTWVTEFRCRCYLRFCFSPPRNPAPCPLLPLKRFSSAWFEPTMTEPPRWQGIRV